MKEKQNSDAKNTMRERMRRLSTKFKMLPPMSPMKVQKHGSSLEKGEGGGNSGGSFLSVVHQMTGGKHMSAVLKAKSKFLHGLLTPIAKAMAGTVPGERTASQIERIVDFVYSTNSNDLISLEPKPLRQVCQWLGHESVAAGQHVFKLGDPQDGFYVLASGMAQVMVKNPKLNYETSVKTLHTGDSFGKIYFPTVEELKRVKQRRTRERQEAAVCAPSEHKAAASENRSIVDRAWASDRMETSKTRHASIYCSRHCELLFLKWSHEAEETKTEALDSDVSEKVSKARANKRKRQKEAIRAFQDHTIRRRYNSLKKCAVFKYMQENDLQRLATVGSIHQWRQGDIVMHQGEVMSNVFVVVRGVCEIRKRRKMSVVKAELAELHSPTGEGEDKLAAGMMWQQQYQQHMNHRLKNIISANREAAFAEESRLKSAVPTQWVKVSMIKGGDMCGEFVLLNPTKSTVSPVQVVADTSVDALVFSLGELKPFLNHGIFSGRTRGELINSVGMHVPSEVKVSLDLAVQRRWEKKKSRIIKSHVVGNRHLHPVGWVDPNPDAII
jgi:CRP-like cAMP-binding protein